MTVFVVQEVPGRNILSAENYGKLELLLPKGTLSKAPGASSLLYNDFATSNSGEIITSIGIFDLL